MYLFLQSSSDIYSMYSQSLSLCLFFNAMLFIASVSSLIFPNSFTIHIVVKYAALLQIEMLALWFIAFSEPLCYHQIIYNFLCVR